LKPTISRKRILYAAPQHLIGKQLGSPLSKDLRGKYNRRSARVIEGDTVKVLRGEFKGIEGKVTNISTEKRGVAIEGIKREKLKGGNVDIYIHSSNVIITALNLEDKWRQNRLEGQKAKSPKSVTPQQPKESESLEKPKEKRVEKPKEKTMEKPKETKKEIKPKNPKTKGEIKEDNKNKEKTNIKKPKGGK